MAKDHYEPHLELIELMIFSKDEKDGDKLSYNFTHKVWMVERWVMKGNELLLKKSTLSTSLPNLLFCLSKLKDIINQATYLNLTMGS